MRAFMPYNAAFSLPKYWNARKPRAMTMTATGFTPAAMMIATATTYTRPSRKIVRLIRAVSCGSDAYLPRAIVSSALSVGAWIRLGCASARDQTVARSVGQQPCDVGERGVGRRQDHVRLAKQVVRSWCPELAHLVQQCTEGRAEGGFVAVLDG